jgi:hypothetical protein
VTSTSLLDRVRLDLQQVARSRVTITYQALAVAMQLGPPNTIQQLTNVLEELMREDAQARRPLLAALVVSKRPPYLPQSGFFQTAAHLHRFDEREERSAFHAREIERVYAQWAGVSDERRNDCE